MACGDLNVGGPSGTDSVIADIVGEPDSLVSGPSSGHHSEDTTHLEHHNHDTSTNPLFHVVVPTEESVPSDPAATQNGMFEIHVPLESQYVAISSSEIADIPDVVESTNLDGAYQKADSMEGTVTLPSLDSTPQLAKCICDICQETFSRKYNLQRHMEMHRSDKRDKTMCPVGGCQRSFCTKDALKTHIKCHHQGNTSQCDICMKTFVYKSSLDRHKLEHAETYRFICPHCGMGLNSKTHFDAHCSGHENTKTHVCLKCNKQFTHISSLHSHTRICGVEEKLFECQVCGKKFKAARYLKEHAAPMHSDRTYQCSTCGETFKHRASLAKHTANKH